MFFLQPASLGHRYLAIGLGPAFRPADMALVGIECGSLAIGQLTIGTALGNARTLGCLACVCTRGTVLCNSRGSKHQKEGEE